MTRIALLAAASAMALSLAACDDDGRIDAPAPAPLAELTTEATDLPFAEPAPVEVYAPDQGYRWAERAYGLQRAVYDTPPDYGFAYDDGEPMVWETEDDWSLYAEPWDDGYRYYYYEPGAAYPYFVRDDDYGYAYDPAGVLIALFDSGGRYLPRETVYRYAPVAGRYYVRGRDLRNAGLQARRVRVSEEAWRVREPRVIRSADPWMRAAREAPAWRGWRERDHDRELARFEREARRRTQARDDRRERPERLDVRPRQEVTSEQFERRQDRDHARDRREATAAERRHDPAPRQARKRDEVQAAHQVRKQTQAEQHRRARAEPQRGGQAQAQRQAHQQQAHVSERRQPSAQQQARKGDGSGRGSARAAESHGRPAAAREAAAHGKGAERHDKRDRKD